MPPVDVGLTCTDCGHFNVAFQMYPPVSERDMDRQGEKRTQPVECSSCGASLADVLLTTKGQEREGPVSRSRNGLARTGLKRSSGKPRPKEGPLTPAEWHRRAFNRQRPRPGKPALCAVTEEPLNESVDEVHHPLEKRLLRARGLHRHVWDERNSMAVKKRIHDAHTSGSKRIPRECLPPGVWDFARSLGEYADWAVQRLEEDHPVTEGVPA